MSADEIQWGDPPLPIRAERRPGRVGKFVAVLKTRPGVWAKYPHPLNHKSGGAVTAINRNRYPGTEWTSRRDANGHVDLYGRWVGES